MTSSLLPNVTNSIWHAFMALPHEQAAAMVSKSKLKVLTANIASLFDLYGVERGLEHYRSTAALHFDHYQYYLLQEVFAVLPQSMTLSEQRNYEERIEEVECAVFIAFGRKMRTLYLYNISYFTASQICWLICRRRYALPADYPVVEPLRFKLFRIFCMLADFCTRNGRRSQCEVLLHASEAAHIVQQLMLGMGIDTDADRRYNRLCADDCPALTLEDFFGLFTFEHELDVVATDDSFAAPDENGNADDDGTEYAQASKASITRNAERIESLNEAIEELYQTYICDIIKKGYLWRRGYLLPTLKEYWFVLQPCELTFYKNATQRDQCGSIALQADNCMVRPAAISTAQNSCAPNKTTTTATTDPHQSAAQSHQQRHHPHNHSASSSKQHHLRFSLTANDRHFELAAADHRDRLQWIAALQLAITYSTGFGSGYQRDQAARRRKRRDLEHRRRNEIELQQRNRHLAEVQVTRAQLEHERLARADAERRASELQLLVREDSRRVAELEDVKMTLERLLLEETQAKRDEEIVRALQARVLAEEWEKRAELEQLQEEQQALLEREREQRREFEEGQREREQLLRAAERRLNEVEAERERLDGELRQARAKIEKSEQSKVALLETRLQGVLPTTLRKSSSSNNGGGGDRLRRALSFMHANREPTYGYTMKGPMDMLTAPMRSRSKSPLAVEAAATNAV